MVNDYFSEELCADGRRWTGWTILLTLLCFFAVVFMVNGVMIYEALSTISGLDTDSAYQAGRMFERDVAAAKAQDARHWRVEAKLRRVADGNERVEVSALDAVGLPVRDLDASVVFERPTNRNLDRAVAVEEESPGHFGGSAVLPSGQWDLVIELLRQGEQVFRSRNRIVLSERSDGRDD